MVTLSVITTRSGDGGYTGTGDGERLLKCDRRIAAVGAVDELTVCVGAVALALSALPGGDEYLGAIEYVQNSLFDLGADLNFEYRPGEAALRVTAGQVAWLDGVVAGWNAGLPKLGSFVLPGGGPAALTAHAARVTCRSAEREVVALSRERDVNPLAIAYLNRLSDLLFVLARRVHCGAERLWQPGAPPPGAARTEPCAGGNHA